MEGHTHENEWPHQDVTSRQIQLNVPSPSCLCSFSWLRSGLLLLFLLLSMLHPFSSHIGEREREKIPNDVVFPSHCLMAYNRDLFDFFNLTKGRVSLFRRIIEFLKVPNGVGRRKQSCTHRRTGGEFILVLPRRRVKPGLVDVGRLSLERWIIPQAENGQGNESFTHFALGSSWAFDDDDDDDDGNNCFVSMRRQIGVGRRMAFVTSPFDGELISDSRWDSFQFRSIINWPRWLG